MVNRVLNPSVSLLLEELCSLEMDAMPSLTERRVHVFGRGVVLAQQRITEIGLARVNVLIEFLEGPRHGRHPAITVLLEHSIDQSRNVGRAIWIGAVEWSFRRIPNDPVAY